ncbi:MAG TPA: tryptophan 7-halogenase [Verrucomicrobiota bacterium]|nr:tryptophan 7-halogenase [Verrucomicrobiota bacterium]
MDSRPLDYEVAILGGSLAGAATALLLLREQPNLRIVVLEKSTRFPRRVGEATVEVSAYFLGRVLGLTQYLNESQLNKQGMRFWFANSKTTSLGNSSEVGGRYLTRLPSWQVDRGTLDEEVLRRAAEAGARILRPAKALRVQLSEGGRQTVEFEEANGKQTLTARWVVDASGFTCMLARQQGWWRRNEAHPTSAAWARWRGVKDWDGLELAKKFPCWAAACHGVRGTATNHFMGDGWWAWCIPLKGGDVSAGVVFDGRLVRWPDGPTPLGERLKEFLCAHPAGREIFHQADPVEGDIKWRANLAYSSTVFAVDGAVLVGDAAGFMDPLYSPGMDWLSYTTTRAAELILASLRPEPLLDRLAAHNRDFRRSYDRWFEALYLNKYEWIGDFELLSVGFKLDLGLYYAGVVSQPLREGSMALRHPVFCVGLSTPPYWMIRCYNRRLTAMARDRRRRGVFGNANTGRRQMLAGFLPDTSAVPALIRALGGWLKLELREGWRTWFRSNLESAPARTATAPASA